MEEFADGAVGVVFYFADFVEYHGLAVLGGVLRPFREAFSVGDACAHEVEEGFRHFLG